jgi:anionic cell wall polymer biosynthesis LytR-Cps2A-Psr (LCP) family protein
MYARSRHSTSDFSRSLRQQQIIKAVMQKLFSASNFMSPTKIEKLY